MPRKAKCLSPRNAHYAHVEVVKLMTYVEIGYDQPKGRVDAMRCAAALTRGAEQGGAGPNGCYNAIIVNQVHSKPPNKKKACK